MKIIKRILTVIATVICLASFTVTASSYADVAADEYYSEAIEKLTTYGIVSGFDGYFRPDANLTRAEFAKVTSLISGLEDIADNNLKYKKFDDVASDHWGTGYINAVAENKLIIGYTDGTFKPEKNVTYAEAVTVILRSLGYSSADLGDNWPAAYMAKADSLGLTQGLFFDRNDSITRGNLCYIINHALQTELNNSTEKLITKLDVTVTDETLLIATRNEDASLAVDELKTSLGTFKLSETCPDFLTLSKAKLVLDDENEIIGFEDVVIPKSVTTTVEQIIDGELYFENGSTPKKLGIYDSTYVYHDGVISNYGTQKAMIEEGSAIAFLYDKAGNVEYIVVDDVDFTDAVTIRNDIYTALNSVGVSKEEIDRAKVFRDGYAVTLEEAEVFDVAYFNRNTGIIYLYSDKISGTYNEAFPNKANVTSIELSGNTFEIETQTAANKLGEKSGSYKIGSKITVLLGKDGKIADVVEMSSVDKASYCILLSHSVETSDDILEAGKQYNYITVLNGEGNTMKYKTVSNYSKMIGVVGQLSYEDNGMVSFTPLLSTEKIFGEIDKKNGKIGNRWLSDDCVIIERTYAPDTKVGTATAEVIKLDDISIFTLDEEQVLYSVTEGEFGDISLLIVENVTNNQYNYGIIKNVSGGSNVMFTNGNYDIYSNGNTVTYSSNFYKNFSSGTAVAFQCDSKESLVELLQLNTEVSLEKVDAADFSRIRIGNTVYELSDNAQIVKKTTKGYEGLSRHAMSDLIGKKVSLFADRKTSQGGLIRIILVLD